MAGTIIQRKGSYCIRYSAGMDPVTGKYRQIWESGFKSPKEAKRRLRELQHQRDIHTLPNRSDTSLGDYLLRWLQNNRENLSPRTAEGYDNIIRRHIIPAMGTIGLQKLTPEDVQRYYTGKLVYGRCDGEGALSPTTVSHHHTLLHRALKSAVTAHLIYFNPADVEDKPQPRRTEIETMTEDDVNTFLEATKKRHPEYHTLFFCFLFTGARRGELLALRWSDVDLLRAEMHIGRSVIQLNDRSLVYKGTKTGKPRMVALSPDTALILRRHKDEREALCAELGLPFGPDSLVFCHGDGSSLLPDSVTQAWTRMVAHAGLKHIKLHGARHTHATLLLDANVHPKVVQERLGHAKISTTLDLYTHVRPELQKAAAAQLDGVLHKVKVGS